MVAPPRILLVTGLQREARTIGGEGIQVILGGGCGGRLAQDLEQAVAQGSGAFLSMGLAGGLRPGLPPGAVVVASSVVSHNERFPTTKIWADNLKRIIPDSVPGDIAGADRVVAETSAKTALRQLTGAAAVDMESHIVARIAHGHGIPFAAIRVIADPAERSLPLAAQAGFSPDGTIDVGGVIRALVAAPGQVFALIKTARDAQKAFRALSRCRRLIGFGFGFPDFG